MNLPNALPLPQDAVSSLAAVHARLDLIQERLAALESWEPAARLADGASNLRRELEAMADRWDKDLVVALVGPSGAGKSTLMNRLAGSNISETGLTRPTTRHVVACVADVRDAAWLQAALGEDGVRVAEIDTGIQGIILLDTPDTNTLPENRALLMSLLEHVDVLVPVFSALNPKLADNIAYLKPFVDRMPADAVLALLTMVDRVPQDELLDDLVPDWLAALEREWGGESLGASYLVNARGIQTRVLEDEAPLHDVDQFDELVDALASGLGQGVSPGDRRRAQADLLLGTYEKTVGHAVAMSASPRQHVGGLLDELTDSASQAVLRDLRHSERRPPVELHVALLGQTAQQLWGPIGWVMALWVLVLRLANALGQAWRGGLAPAWLGQGPDRGTTLWAGTMADRLVRALDRAMAESWPPIGDALTKAGFDALRPQPSLTVSSSELADTCQREAVRKVDRLVRRLSNVFVQFLFNAPILGLAGWVAWDAVYGLVSRQFLPPGYLDQALTALVALWAIAFALYQMLISAALRRAYRRRLVKSLSGIAADRMVARHRDALAQVDALSDVLGSS